jgi:hypothetical protein
MSFTSITFNSVELKKTLDNGSKIYKVTFRLPGTEEEQRGEIFARQEPSLNTVYQVESAEYKKDFGRWDIKIKWSKPGGGGGGFGRGMSPEEREQIARNSALGHAIKLATEHPEVKAHITAANVQETVLKLADRFSHYIMTGQHNKQ